MSSYLSIYLKDPKNKKYILLHCVSRCDKTYQTFYDTFHFEWGKLKPMEAKDFDEWLTTIAAEKKLYEDNIIEYKAKIEQIYKANNSLEEKLEAISEFEASIKDNEEELDYMIRPYAIVYSLQDIMENYSLSSLYKNEILIYSGIEVETPKDEQENYIDPCYD